MKCHVNAEFLSDLRIFIYTVFERRLIFFLFFLKKNGQILTMSNDNDSNDTNYYSDLLDKYVNRFDYSDFTVLERIDTGSSARIKITTFKDTKDPKFVLKCFNYDKITLKEVINEVKYVLKVVYSIMEPINKII